jgi:hypothetical protein
MKQKPGFPASAKSPRGNATLEKSSVIGLVSGSHTYFLAAGSHEEVRAHRAGMGAGGGMHTWPQSALRARMP